MLNATLCLLRGMGVQTVLRDDPDYYRRLLRFWKSILREQDRSRAASPAASPDSRKLTLMKASVVVGIARRFDGSSPADLRETRSSRLGRPAPTLTSRA